MNRLNLSDRHRYILLATVAYVLLALAWIVLSDWLLLLFLDIEALAWLSMAKGVFFVLVSGGVFCFVLQAVPPDDDMSGPLPANDLPADLTARVSPRWLTYGYAVALVAAMLLVRINLPVAFGDRPLLILFMLPIIVSALLGGFGPGLIATLAAAAIAFYNIPPVDSFSIAASHDLFQWSLLIVNGLTVSLISEVMHRSRHRERMRLRQLDASTEELRQSEDRYRTLFENSLDAVLLTIPDGGILSANRAACRMFDRTEEEICVLGRAALVDSSDPCLAVLLEERARTGKTFGELTFFRKDGSRFPAEVSSVVFKDTAGNPRTSMIIRDVTARREAEETLRESEARYRQLFEANPLPMWLYNLETLVFLAVNDAAVAHYGYSRDEFLAMTIKDIRPKKEIPELLKYLIQDKDGLNAAGIWCHRKKDGTLIDVEISTHTLMIDGQQAKMVLAQDVTERKRGEQERQKLIDELEKRNAELDRFTYTVSHDLKSPLVTILGFIGQLELDLADNEPDNVKADLAFISSAANQMRELLDSLLQLSRAGRTIGPPQSIDLPALVRQVVEQIGDRLAHARVQIAIPAGLPAIEGDPIRLREVFQNLLENAAKFTADQSEPCIEVGCTVGEGEVRCFVRDNGIGIPPEYQKKVFGLFEKLDASREGTGVGLAIVRRIVEEHGGQVWVESAGSGHGSTLYFSLPV